MSHFRSHRSFQRALCGLKFSNMGTRNVHEQTCADCAKQRQLLEGN